MKSCPDNNALTGWRSQAWALVLFVALLRGLLPHAALAAMLDQGNPQLAWCAPGKAPAAEVSALAAHSQCVCASAAEGLLAPDWAPAQALAPASSDRSATLPERVELAHLLVLRARGPPLTPG